jgi:hypothetical protein
MKFEPAIKSDDEMKNSILVNENPKACFLCKQP